MKYLNIMGKGDKKSKRGKIIMGSYGVSRPKRKIVEKLVSSQAKSKPENPEKTEKPEVKQKATVAEAKTKSKVVEPKSKIAKKPKSEEKPENLKAIDEAEDKET